MKLPATVTSSGLPSSSPRARGWETLAPPVSGDPQPLTAQRVKSGIQSL